MFRVARRRSNSGDARWIIVGRARNDTRSESGKKTPDHVRSAQRVCANHRGRQFQVLPSKISSIMRPAGSAGWGWRTGVIIDRGGEYNCAIHKVLPAQNKITAEIAAYRGLRFPKWKLCIRNFRPLHFVAMR